MSPPLEPRLAGATDAWGMIGGMPVEEPHLVSRVISRRFADSGGLLAVFDIATGRRRTGLGPDGFGYTGRLSPTDADAFERAWREVEDALPGALAVIDAGGPLDPATVAVLRDCVAMHWARSADLIRLHDDVFRLARVRGIEELARRLEGDPRVEFSYRQAHHGLRPTSGERRREARRIAERIYDESVAGIESSSYRADRMLELFEIARSSFRDSGVEVLIASPGEELLIGDSPAKTVSKDGLRSGPFARVPLTDAGSVWMPVGPGAAIALGRTSSYAKIDPPMVEWLNRVQAGGGIDRVACRPGSPLEARLPSLLGSARPGLVDEPRSPRPTLERRQKP